ncbi:MAG: universal stress protein [Pseudomonadota bacterium]|nr:universal stress protein [Pseudomonadota bacterium]
MRKLDNLLLYVGEVPYPTILERVVLIAEAYGAKITIAGVVESFGSHAILSRPDLDLREIELQLLEERKGQLTDAVGRIDDRGVSISIMVLVGDPVVSIIELVQDRDIDLLIKAPEPEEGLRGRLFGGIDMQLLRACPCPVEIGHPQKIGGANRALVAIDYDGDDDVRSRLNDRILDSALLATHGRHPEIYIVHAWSLYGYTLLAHGRGSMPPDRLNETVEQERAKRQEWLENRVERFRSGVDASRQSDFKPVLELLQGKPELVIPRRIRELDADVLGIGTASRSGLKGLLIGNTAEEILYRVDCAVVVLKPEGFVSPVQ